MNLVALVFALCSVGLYENIRKGKGENMQDGLVLMYMKDGVLYPVGLTNEEFKLLQDLGRVFEPLAVIFDRPQGKAINLKER